MRIEILSIVSQSCLICTNPVYQDAADSHKTSLKLVNVFVKTKTKTSLCTSDSDGDTITNEEALCFLRRRSCTAHRLCTRVKVFLICVESTVQSYLPPEIEKRPGPANVK